MNVGEVVKYIEKPFGGNLNGVSMLFCGAEDMGGVAITLARHSARILLLTESTSQYEAITDEMPQAVNMRVVLTDISRWLADNKESEFDVMVSLGHNLEKEMMQLGLGKVVELKYADGEYHMN